MAQWSQKWDKPKEVIPEDNPKEVIPEPQPKEKRWLAVRAERGGRKMYSFASPTFTEAYHKAMGHFGVAKWGETTSLEELD